MSAPTTGIVLGPATAHSGFAYGINPALYPLTGPQFKARTGITLNSLYLFDEASGNLQDKVGSAHLTVATTPGYRSVRTGRVGIHYNGAGDAHTANVHALGTDDFLLGAVFVNAGAVGSEGVVGRGNASAGEWVGMYTIIPGDGKMGATLSDSGANNANIVCNTDTRTTGVTLGILQGDRNGTTARMRIANGRFLEQQTASIAGFATFDGAAQTFGFGAYPAVGASGIWVGYGFVILGAAARGANTPRDISRALGFE